MVPVLVLVLGFGFGFSPGGAEVLKDRGPSQTAFKWWKRVLPGVCVARVMNDLPSCVALRNSPMIALCLSTNVSRSFLKQIWLFTGQHEAFQKALAN
jgi:hypothetical protein